MHAEVLKSTVGNKMDKLRRVFSGDDDDEEQGIVTQVTHFLTNHLSQMKCLLYYLGLYV